MRRGLGDLGLAFLMSLPAALGAAGFAALGFHPLASALLAAVSFWGGAALGFLLGSRGRGKRAGGARSL
jgi:p-aminobenzoyl-glutamate transporter AbgT